MTVTESLSLQKRIFLEFLAKRTGNFLVSERGVGVEGQLLSYAFTDAKVACVKIGSRAFKGAIYRIRLF